MTDTKDEQPFGQKNLNVDKDTLNTKLKLIQSNKELLNKRIVEYERKLCQVVKKPLLQKENQEDSYMSDGSAGVQTTNNRQIQKSQPQLVRQPQRATLPSARQMRKEQRWVH